VKAEDEQQIVLQPGGSSAANEADMNREGMIWCLAICGSLLADVRQAMAADAPAWMHAAANAPLLSYDAKTDAVLLYSEDITTVQPDGKMKGIERRSTGSFVQKDESTRSHMRTSGGIPESGKCAGGVFLKAVRLRGQ